MSDEDDDKAKKDMIEQCRSYYSDNQSQLDIIDQFKKEYLSDQAIKWYTRDAFVYRLLNRAFRTENIDIIYIFRFFVKNLYQQLQRLHKEFVELVRQCEITNIILYRGQAMKLDELEKIKCNSTGFAYLNTFLSTTMDKEVAKVYATVEQNQSDLVSVLFELSIDIDIFQKPFADIRQHSYMKDESEILLSAGTQFQVVSIEEIDQIWYIYLTTINDDQENSNNQLRQFEYYLKNTIKPVTTMKTFIHYLYLMGEDIKSNQYKLLLKTQECSCIEELEKRIDTNNTNIDTLIEIYQCIGAKYFQVDDFTSALRYFEKIIELMKDEDTSAILDKAHQIDMFHQMGISYFRQNEYHQSLKYFQNALEIYFQLAPNNNIILKNLLSTLTDVYFSLENYGEALTSAKMTLNIYLEHFPKDLLDICFQYERIGIIYAKLDHYQEAFNNLEKALQLSNILPVNNHFIVDTYYSIASICRKLNENDKAKFYTEKANDVMLNSKYLKNSQIKTKSINENMLMIIRKRAKYDDRVKYSLENVIDIALLHEKEGNNQKAIKYFQEAVDIIKDNLNSDENRTTTVSLLNRLGDMYHLIGCINESLVYYLKALDICPSKNYQQIAYSSVGIGNIYLEELFNNEQALISYKKALEMKLKYLDETNAEIIDLYDTIGGVYLASMANEDNQLYNGQMALNYFHSILQIYQKNQISYDRLILDVYIEIGDVYRCMKEHQLAIDNYKQAIDIALTLNDDEEKNPVVLKQLYIDIGLLQYILFKQTDEILHNQNALITLEQAIQIQTSYYLQEDSQFILVFKMLGDLTYHSNNDLRALNYYQKAIDCEKRAQRPFDELYIKEILDLYLYAGLLFHRLDNIDLAFECWNRASQYILDDSTYSNIYQKLQVIFDKASHLHALKYKEQVTFF
ncbi:unnamed protein product [Rotaria sp. Silwood2]|nr:unnamed protein product [Rotaria sp. Silwood2]